MSSESQRFEYNFGEINVVEIPNNPAVKDGVVVLTGGCDNQGRPIIVFPIEMNIKIQMSLISSQELVEALVYYSRIIRVPDKSAGLAFLIDFRACSMITIDAIINSINKFKIQFPSLMGNVYIVRPQDRELSYRLKLKLGIKKLNIFSRLFSKKVPLECTENFQSVLLKTIVDLGKYFDQNLLTSDFGGTLRYDHAIWLLLKQNIDEYLEHVLRIRSTFPDAEEKIKQLKEYQSTETEAAAEEAIKWLRRRFNEIVSDSKLEDLFMETDEILGELSFRMVTSGTFKYEALRGNPHITNNHMFLNAIRAKLVELQGHFQKLLSEAEKKVNLSDNFKEAKKVGGDALRWIEDVGFPALETQPKIGSNLNEAELIAREYHNELFIPGMKSISRCNEICLNMQKNNIADDSGEVAIMKAQYLQKLLTTTATFNKNLNTRRKLYSDVYQFHLTLNRIVSWLKRTIKSIPVDLLNYQENMNGNEPFPIGSVWKAKIHQYLLRHPAPKLHQIDLIEKLTPVIKDINVRNEARLLSYRLRVLMKVMSGNNVTVSEVREVIEWKDRLQADFELQCKDNEFDNINDKNKSSSSLFLKIEPPILTIEGSRDVIFPDKNNITMSSSNLNISKLSLPPPDLSRIRTSPRYNKNVPKVNHLSSHMSRSQPRLNINSEDESDYERRKELIILAEKSVKESLKDRHLINERDLGLGSRKKDEEELSLILNQLLRDINSQKGSDSRKTSRNPSSLRDLSDYVNSSNRHSSNSLHMRREVDYL